MKYATEIIIISSNPAAAFEEKISAARRVIESALEEFEALLEAITVTVKRAVSEAI